MSLRAFTYLLLIVFSNSYELFFFYKRKFTLHWLLIQITVTKALQRKTSNLLVYTLSLSYDDSRTILEFETSRDFDQLFNSNNSVECILKC